MLPMSEDWIGFVWCNNVILKSILSRAQKCVFLQTFRNTKEVSGGLKKSDLNADIDLTPIKRDGVY